MTRLLRNRIATFKQDILTLCIQSTKDPEQFARDFLHAIEYLDGIIEDVQKDEEEQPEYSEEF